MVVERTLLSLVNVAVVVFDVATVESKLILHSLAERVVTLLFDEVPAVLLEAVATTCPRRLTKWLLSPDMMLARRAASIPTDFALELLMKFVFSSVDPVMGSI